MSENSNDTSKQSLDLSSLSGLDFGPSWTDGKSNSKEQAKQFDKQRGKGRGSDRRSGGGPRDRRSGGRPQRSHSGGGEGRGRREGGEGRRERRGGDRRPHAPRPFEPTVKVDLYPQDEAFDALVTRLTATSRTYQLFEIAHLLLEKPERFVVVVGNLPNRDAGGEVAPLYFSVPGHLPFETEEEAINHVLNNNLDLFFDIEEIEVEPPKGSFQVVNRCTLTGELLGPPNYHRYQEFVQRHYSSRITGMSFERFQSKIETVKEQEVIDAWLDSMKKGARYTLKERAEGEPESFETMEAVRHFLLHHRKDKVVGSGTSVRFAGRDIERLPKGDIRRSVEAYVEQQQKFPLDSANNIRGRLRRHHFTVYKKGGKGISFVCAVKRKFRDSSTKFSDSIQALIEFLDQNENILATDLPKAYLNIEVPQKVAKPEQLKMAEPEVAASEGDAVVEEEAKPEEAPAAEAPVELSAEDNARLEAMMIDLRWLITEGYVTEYGDGTLLAPPPMPEPKKKEAPVKAEDAKPAEVTTEAPVAEAEEPKAEAAAEPEAAVNADEAEPTKEG